MCRRVAKTFKNIFFTCVAVSSFIKSTFSLVIQFIIAFRYHY